MHTAILGEGVSGRGVAALLEKKGGAYSFFDESRGGDAQRLGALLAARRPRVVYSPGFAQEHPWLQAAGRLGLECEGEFSFALRHWPGRVLAVTGTKGKSTLTAFLAHALTAQGLEATAVGNIGEPLSALIARTEGRAGSIAVCEVSSYQAESLKSCPAEHIFWTNLAPDHLDRHGSFEAYARAKAQLLWSAPETVKLWAPASVYQALTALGLPPLPGTPVMLPAQAPPESLFSKNPYAELYALAAAFWAQQGWPPEALAAAATSFVPLPHRMQAVATLGTFKKIHFWNDSTATNTHAALAAINALAPEPIYWIAGGASKGQEFQNFCQKISQKIQKAFLIGETASTLKTYLGPQADCYKSLPEALHAAVSAAQAGQHAHCHVLLSPACASTDLFKSYAHRGDLFVQEVQRLRASGGKG